MWPTCLLRRQPLEAHPFQIQANSHQQAITGNQFAWRHSCGRMLEGWWQQSCGWKPRHVLEMQTQETDGEPSATTASCLHWYHKIVEKRCCSFCCCRHCQTACHYCHACYYSCYFQTFHHIHDVSKCAQSKWRMVLKASLWTLGLI